MNSRVIKLGEVLDLLPQQDADEVAKVINSNADTESKKQSLIRVFEKNRHILLQKNMLPKYFAYAVIAAVERIRYN